MYTLTDTERQMTKSELLQKLERMGDDMRFHASFWDKRKDAFARRTAEFYRGRLWLVEKFISWVKELQ